MNNFITIILAAAFGVIGNIIYFEYRLKKERRKDILKRRLTDLLLPLYYILKDDELVIYAWLNNIDADPCEYESDKPERLLSGLQKIIKENLYLADDELQEACLMFIEWAYKADKNDRFQRAHVNDLSEDNVLKKFVDIVYKKYNETRKEYIS